MHEVAFAQSIFDIAREVAVQNNAPKILGVKLRIGELSCINLDSLRFAFSCIAQGSIAEGAELCVCQLKQSAALEIESIEVDE